MIPRIWPGLLAFLLLCVQNVGAADYWFNYQTGTGETIVLNDNRQPALYTRNFGDCLGSSTINVTRFDVAYYKDNMTILWHMAGETGVTNDSIMMSIGVYAYGENRYELIFNPCDANIDSLCPLNASLPIEATTIIPVSASDVAAIIPLALTIPDFEGEAILRIFSNTTRQEIACYSAVVTNGASFSHPAAVGTVLGLFTLVAVIASFATAIYGEAVPTMRLHYAHSLSVGVVFAVWQHIFFSGALSVNWASVLPAWWSNFAWAGGMIYTESMQSNLNSFIGNDLGNTSQVGAAQSGSATPSVGGGFDISAIYRRALYAGIKRAADLPHDLPAKIYGRQTETGETSSTTSFSDRRDGYQWYGDPVPNGLPLPGNYSGFAGTLGYEGISASTAFLTGFLWFLIILVILVASVIAFKWTLEGLIRIKWIKTDRLKFFRDRWIGYSAVVALRICYIGFFAMMFLSIFQFTYLAGSGAQGIAAIVFIVFFIGMPLAAGYAVWYKKAMLGSTSGKVYEHKILMGKVPFPVDLGKKGPEQTAVELQTSEPGHAHSESKSSTVPIWKRIASTEKTREANDTNGKSRSIHDDDDYIKKFGWLAARFRRTRWWFFTAWLFYEFIRAVFYGGASGYSQAQVFGLLIVEVIAFGLIIWMKPYEGQRLNVLVVYCLGFSKVATVALSAAFDVKYNLPRIPTTVIGVVIIVIQGILTIITMIAIVVGAISSWMSIKRNTEDFRPRRWYGMREKYFDHLDRTVNDLPRPPKVKKPKNVEPEEVKAGFEMKNVKRVAKIEDEDPEFQGDMAADPNSAYMSTEDLSSTAYGKRAMTPLNRSRANSRAASIKSFSSTNLPYGARSHRPSWSTRDFSRAGWEHDLDESQTAGGDDAIAPVTPNKRHSGAFSTKQPSLRPMTSSSSLRVGAEVSSTDAIGVVPAPTVRPRAGTMGSVRSSRRLSGGFHGTDHLEIEVPPIPSQYSSQRNSYMSLNADAGESSSKMSTNYQQNLALARSTPVPLTPAQEHEEWDLKLTKTNSNANTKKSAPQ
ncbi:unnamed protein product [Cercospora beticola]|nr:unnamed protein product [Cercospora beticola]